MLKKTFITAILLCLTAGPCIAQNEQSSSDQPKHLAWAQSPPMGWNSWDIFGTTITEKQVREQALAMRKHLLPADYDILTVDIQWYMSKALGIAGKARVRDLWKGKNLGVFTDSFGQDIPLHRAGLYRITLIK